MCRVHVFFLFCLDDYFRKNEKQDFIYTVVIEECLWIVLKNHVEIAQIIEDQLQKTHSAMTKVLHYSSDQYFFILFDICGCPFCTSAT